MIKNEKQYRITKNELKKFKDALVLLKKSNVTDIHPLLIKAQYDSIESQIQELEEEVLEYEKLKSGEVKKIVIDINDISTGLINARIARGYNHEKLADLLGIKAQQIQKYESENYTKTSLNRLLEIIKILEIGGETVLSLSNRKIERSSFKFSLPPNVDTEGIGRIIRDKHVPFEIC
ncbi:helix-turn-helix domain-containing protein [Kriegella aquimaris]|uniref:Helix-turn-helix n=1 Tax=Kriegella aquimaris TaxID=192904 RepID=A0A1G9IGU1_9FLAO|nr:helix-turn-helix transcriptional regulator [Kriegella aquimaris]SDL24322.1 Helix-turn-helix [Kriegella aquimaris]